MRVRGATMNNQERPIFLIGPLTNQFEANSMTRNPNNF